MFNNLSVRDNFTIKLNALKIDKKSRDLIIDNCCKKFKIDGKIDNLISTLSGGEKKRVQLAMLETENCDVILLDEPIANLDKDNCDMILNSLFELKDKLIIIISHQYIEKKEKLYTLLEMKDGSFYEK